jgi:hypothetical protein
MTWQTIHQILSQWPEDSDLAGLRDKVGLAILSAKEQEFWRNLDPTRIRFLREFEQRRSSEE